MIKVLGLSSSIQHDYTHDTFGRLDTVACGVYSADYDYQPYTDILATTTHKNNGSPVLTTSRVWQHGMRLQSIANVVNGQTISSHNYVYDAAHRRTQATLEEGSLWKYDYNDRNEVISGKRYWSDWTPVAGQQFEYAFDNIGNRTSTKAGGNEEGGGLRAASYSANNLNQITSRTVPGAVDVLGVAKATASVTVNSVAATTRKTEYFHEEVWIANAAGPTNAAITVTASQSGNDASESGNLLVPPAAQIFSYDNDGNMTFDGVWTYHWDGENRLKEMSLTNVANLTNSERKRLEFAYDYLGRRIVKTVHSWNGSQFLNLESTNRFLYDGWNLLCEIERNGKPVRGYMWGKDLSGTIEKAGGVGGLLIIGEYTWSSGATNGFHFPAYDGNGNIVALVTTDGTLTARYQHGAFGEPVGVSGSFGKGNPFRWSTKYTDEETRHLHYSYRFYNPSSGRWTSRDPSWEKGGLNLYAFAANEPTTKVDPLGLEPEPWDHHPATKQFLKTLPDGPGKDYLWNKFTIPVKAPHRYDRAHRAYNPAVLVYADNWMKANNLTGEALAQSEELAKKFADDIMNLPSNTTIGGYNQANMIGGKIAKAVVILGALAAAHSTYAFAPELMESWHSYGKSAAEGDQELLDLDAVGTAIAVQNMTGDYFTTQYVLDFLLQDLCQ